MESDNFDIVLIGNYTKDTIISPSGTRIVDGGGFNYGAHVAAMMGLKAAAITRLAGEDKHVVDALVKIGVEVFPFYSPSSTLMQLFYPTSNVDERVLTVKAVADPFLPEHVKNVHAKVFLLNGSARGEIGIGVIRELRKKNALIVADLQGYIRVIAPDGTLHYQEWEEKEEVLGLVDVLKSDAVEGEFLTGESDVRKQALRLSELGPGEIVLSHRKGVLVLAGGNFHEAPFTYKKLVGRSGRGDTCISAYACKRLSSSAEESTIWTAAVTSLKMEAEGPIRREMQEVEEHIRMKYS